MLCLVIEKEYFLRFHFSSLPCLFLHGLIVMLLWNFIFPAAVAYRTDQLLAGCWLIGFMPEYCLAVLREAPRSQAAKCGVVGPAMAAEMDEHE